MCPLGGSAAHSEEAGISLGPWSIGGKWVCSESRNQVKQSNNLRDLLTVVCLPMAPPIEICLIEAHEVS